MSSSRCCTATTRSRRSGVRRQRPSGLRRHVPLPEQGASTRTTSAFSRESSSSPSSLGGLRSRVSISAPARFARSGSFDRRPRLLSVARMRAPGAAAANASALPPAPAHKSTMASPSRGSQARAMSWLPSSCTSTRPASYAGWSSTLLSDGSRMPQGLSGVGTPAGKPRSTSSRELRATLTRRSNGARSRSAANSPSAMSGDSSGSSHRGMKADGAAASPAFTGSGPRGSPNSSSMSGSSSARPTIAARPLSGRSPERRIARNTSSRTARRSLEPA